MHARADTVDDRSWLPPPQLTAIQRKQIIDTMTLARCNELTAQKLLLYVGPAPCHSLNTLSNIEFGLGGFSTTFSCVHRACAWDVQKAVELPLLKCRLLHYRSQTQSCAEIVAEERAAAQPRRKKKD